MTTALPQNPTVGDLVQMLRSAGMSRRSKDAGRAMTLTETAVVMYAEGHFDRIPTRREIRELEQSAMRKLARGIK